MDRNRITKNAAAISALLAVTYCATSPAKPVSMSAPPLVIAQGDQDLQDLVRRFAGKELARSAIGPDDPLDWDMPRLSINDASLRFYARLGVQGTVDAHDMDLLVGPFRGRFTPRQLWSMMMDAGCAEARISATGHTYSASPKPIPGLNDVKTHYALPAAPLVDMVHRLSAASKGLPLSIAPAMYSQLTVGPIEGDMTMEEALLTILGQVPAPGYTYLYLESSNEITLIGKDVERSRQDLTQDAARAQLCLARIPPQSESLLVVATPLPPLRKGLVEPTTELDRQRIEETGVDSVPELLQHLAQTAFHRGRGYRPSGAQYAELRGVGHQFSKVLINGRPTFGTAADLMDGAFDLNVVPLSAVEKVEIVLDAVSLAHGADAIGGTVNIVLRESDEAIVDARYESANGGAAIYSGSLIAGLGAEASSASIVLDYSYLSPLVGAARDRWRNQDWTQHGGTDHRTLSSEPPNVRSLNGERLPGLSSAFAAVGFAGNSPVFQEAAQNLTSLLAWRSIVPEFYRKSASAIAHHDIGTTSLSSEFLISQRTNRFQHGPEVISDFILGAEHPQNPFGVPVSISAALTGLPPIQFEYESTLTRGVLAAAGTIGSSMSYESYLLHTSDSADTLNKNEVDLSAVFDALSGDAAIPFNIVDRAPGDGSGQEFMAPRRAQSQKNGVTQVAARLTGAMWHLPAGPISIDLGLEARREFTEVSTRVRKTDRDAVSGYGSLGVPLIGALTAEYGMRRDEYADLPPVSSHQYIVRWKPVEHLRMHASYSDAFDPPDLYELKFPRAVVDFVPIFDPKRGEIAPVTFIYGGNEQLRPTTGDASSIGVSVGREDSLFASLSLWEISLKGRIGIVPWPTLLANEDTAISSRILREPASAEDLAANRPGRLKALDVTRANFGSTKVQGADLSLATTLQTRFGSLRSKLDVSYTGEFRFSELPTIDSPARERTGVASVLGTITDWRLRGTVSYTHQEWQFSLLARYNSCYDDFDPAENQVSGRAVCPGLGLDANVSKELSRHIRFALGVADVYTSSVPFSAVSASGFDESQRNLTGPTAYFGVTFKH